MDSSPMFDGFPWVLGPWQDGGAFVDAQAPALPLHRRLLFAGGMALCYGKAPTSTFPVEKSIEISQNPWKNHEKPLRKP